MGNQFYSELPEQNANGPMDKHRTQDMTSATRKGAKAGWRLSSGKSPSSPSKDTSGWRCSTSKAYGTRGWRTSTNKSPGVL